MIAGTCLLEGSNKYCSLLDPCLTHVAYTSSSGTVRVCMFGVGGRKQGKREMDIEW